MPQPKNHLLRAILPVLIFVIGVGIVYAVYRTSSKNTTPPNPPASTTTAGTPQPTPPAPTSAPPNQPAPAEAKASTPAQQTPSAPPPAGLHAVNQALTQAEPLGSLDPTGVFKQQITFATAGAGINSMQLADYYTDIKQTAHVEVQSQQIAPRVDANGNPLPSDVLVPFAALAVQVTPAGGEAKIIPLAGSEPWQPVATKDPTHERRFEATIADADNKPVLKIERTFLLTDGSLEVKLSQHISNLSASPIAVKWYEVGTVDLPGEVGGYGGDKRRVRFGYMLPPEKDPTQSQVVSNDYVMARQAALGKRESVDVGGHTILMYKDTTLWPNTKSTENRYSMVWTGMANRYFGVAPFPLADAAATGPAKTLAWVDAVSRVVLDRGGDNPLDQSMGLRLESRVVTLAAAGTSGDVADFSHGIFAGPLNRKVIASNPLFTSFGLDGLVVYNFGGWCAPCTFTFLTDALLWILQTLHDKVFHDWALAVIFLVLIVRTCLHPVTKWSQVRMGRFGKQMQGIQPKQKVLQERYKDDPKKLQEETAKLWREEGISPTGMLGCLPMFLQTPVWIALYASLFFFEPMRQQHGFYGLFQHIQPATSPFWRFLGDLSEPDRFIYFGHPIATLPMLGPITSINILPIFLAVVFFIQQKYLTPPTAATMTPEQEFQTKMMRWLTVFMFPVFMYNAPSGLAIYFICNSSFAIIESRYIRSHMSKYDKPTQAAGVGTSMFDRKDKKPAKQGLMAKLMAMAEEKQKEMERQQKNKKR